MDKEEKNFKKATLFTDPLGNTCVKYDLVDIELNEDQQSGKTIIRTQPEMMASNFQKPEIIRYETVKFLTCLSLATFFLFLPTGIPSVVFSQLMKKSYLNFDYEKALRYKLFAKIFSYLNVFLGLLTFVAIMICIPLM